MDINIYTTDFIIIRCSWLNLPSSTLLGKWLFFESCTGTEISVQLARLDVLHIITHKWYM